MKNNIEIDLLNIFIKELTIKNYEPLELLNKKNNFDTEISPLGIKSRRLNENKYEVVSDCNINIYNDTSEKLLNITIELSGIFKIYPEITSLKELIYVHCANFLYPYLRTEIMNISAKVGIQYISLPYINFKYQYEKMNKNC